MSNYIIRNKNLMYTKYAPFWFPAAVYIAGVVASIGVSVLGVFCILSVLQLAMISSKERVGFKYTHLVMTKLALALLAGEAFSLPSRHESLAVCRHGIRKCYYLPSRHEWVLLLPYAVITWKWMPSAVTAWESPSDCHCGIIKSYHLPSRYEWILPSAVMTNVYRYDLRES